MSGYQKIEEGGASSSSQYPGFKTSSTIAGNPEAARVNKYETSLPIRVDIEASLCYILGCFSGVLFLILEQKNDYVRFHAWQSCLVFTPMLILHMIFVWQMVVSIIILVFDLLLIGLLIFKAYTFANRNLERFEVPFLGKYASQWVDNE